MSQKSSQTSPLPSSPGSDLASAFRELRRRRGLSQIALADLTGRKQARISLVEGGRDDPRLSTLIALARALGSELVLVPREHIAEVRQIVNASSKKPNRVPTFFEEMYVPDPDEEEEED
jgi:transcriptional regulator with XRE-family HTH domain